EQEEEEEEEQEEEASAPARRMDVVWLKRDVRLVDHAPLWEAATGGRPFRMLFMYEPDHSLTSRCTAPTWRSWRRAWRRRGAAPPRRRGGRRARGGRGARPPLRDRAARGGHRRAGRPARGVAAGPPAVAPGETEHGASFARDRRVARWCRAEGVRWVQLPQSGVVRGLAHGGGRWQAAWRAHLEAHLQEDALPTRSASTAAPRWAGSGGPPPGSLGRSPSASSACPRPRRATARRAKAGASRAPWIFSRASWRGSGGEVLGGHLLPEQLLDGVQPPVALPGLGAHLAADGVAERGGTAPDRPGQVEEVA
ncbi:unnamed protein product, partial [Prorocentrum cordatum]